MFSQALRGTFSSICQSGKFVPKQITKLELALNFPVVKLISAKAQRLVCGKDMPLDTRISVCPRAHRKLFKAWPWQFIIERVDSERPPSVSGAKAEQFRAGDRQTRATHYDSHYPLIIRTIASPFIWNALTSFRWTWRKHRTRDLIRDVFLLEDVDLNWHCQNRAA